MAERPIAAVLKTVEPARVPGVQIPLSPLFLLCKRQICVSRRPCGKVQDLRRLGNPNGHPRKHGGRSDKKRLPYTLQIARRNFSRLFHGVCNALAGPFFSPSMGFNGGITAFRFAERQHILRYPRILRSVITDKPTSNATVSHSPAKSRFFLKRSIFRQIIGPNGIFFLKPIQTPPTAHNSRFLKVFKPS